MCAMSMLTRTPGPAGATPRSEPEKKQSIATRLNWLRAGVLGAHDALDAHLTTEHNIDPDDLTNPWAAAFSSFVAFLVGSLLPLATMLLFPPSIRIPETFATVLVALALTGWVSATLGEAPRGRAVARLLIGGAVAMALTYGVGHLFGVNV